MKYLRWLRLRLPIILSAILLQVQLGYMNGLHFEVKVSVGFEKAFADPCIDAGTCCSSHGADSSLCISQCQQNPGSSGCPEPSTGGGGNGNCVNPEGDNPTPCLVGEIEQDDMIINWSQWIMNLLFWLFMMLDIWMLRACMLKGSSCGWSALPIGAAGVAMLVGEIIAIAHFQNTVDKLSYRKDMLQKYARDCETDSSKVAADVGALQNVKQNGDAEDGDFTGGNVCDQMQALKDQKESLEHMRTGANWKLGLQITALIAIFLAWIMEVVDWAQKSADELAAEAFYVGCVNAVTAVTCPPNQATCLSAKAGCIAALGTSKAQFVAFLAGWHTSGVDNEVRCTKARAALATATGTLKKCALSEDPLILAAYQACVGASGYVTDRMTAAWNCVVGGGSSSCTTHCSGTTGVCPSDPVSGLMCTIVGSADEMNNNLILPPGEFSYKNYASNGRSNYSHEFNKETLGLEYKHHFSNEVFKFENFEIERLEQIGDHKTFWNKITYSRSPVELNRTLSLKEYHRIAPVYHADDYLQDKADMFLAPMIKSVQAGEDLDAGHWVKIILWDLIVGAAVILTAGLVSSQQIMTKTMATPGERSWWLVGQMAVLGLGILVNKTQVIDELSDQIDKIQGILDDATGATENNGPDDEGGTSSGGGGSDGAWAEEYNNAFNEGTDGGGVPCPHGGTGKTEAGERCKAAPNQIKGALKALGIGGLAGVSDVASGPLKEMTGSGGDPSKLHNEEHISSAARKVGKAYKRLKKKIQKMKGISDKDFKKKGLAHVARMKNALDKALAKNGLTAQAVAEKLSGSGFKPKDDKDGLNEAIKKAASAQPAAAGGDGGLNFDFGGPGGNNGGMDFGEDVEEDPEFAANQGIADNDIMSNPGGDIWKALTVRYMKTAYPVFFEEGIIEPMETNEEEEKEEE